MNKVYHHERYAKERSRFLQLSQLQESLHRQYRDLEYTDDHPANAAYEDICEYLGVGESVCDEIIKRERDVEDVLESFKRAGSPIFQFTEGLVEALHHTSVGDLEIGHIRFPYGTFYVDLGGFDFLPEISDTHKIEGFYVRTDQIEDELRHNIETANFLMQCKNDKGVFEQSFSPENQKLISDSLKNAPAALIKAQRRLDEFLLDPYNFDYESSQDYLGVYFYFTFTRRGGELLPVGPRIIVEEPDFRVYLFVPRPSCTVDDAIAHTKKHGIPADTYDDEVAHEDSVLNVTNRPEFLDDSIRLAFNIFCYLDYPDRDEDERLSNDKVQSKLEKASTEKERKRILSKAANQGIRMVKFFGRRTFRNDPAGPGATPSRHWRRGHWRRHAYGEGLKLRKRLWIRPVVVSPNASDAPGRKVYDMSQKGIE